MSKLKTAMNLLKRSPKKIFGAVARNGCLKWIPDKIYLKIMYYCETGQHLNLENPVTFNEKLQWLKLYDRRPEYVSYVDKYSVRDYIRQTIGEEYLIPLIGIYKDVEEIPWNELPDRFVLKCTHGSGCNIFCNDKKLLDIEDAKSRLKRWMQINYFWAEREWPYKNVPPRIVCEQYIEDEDTNQLKDYKIFCFQGEPKLIEVDFDRFINHKRNIYDLNWNYMDVTIKYPNDASTVIPKPPHLEVLLNLAKNIAFDYPHVRTDFYCVGEKIYFGEMTFYHGGGYERFSPDSLGITMGKWISWPIK